MILGIEHFVSISKRSMNRKYMFCFVWLKKICNDYFYCHSFINKSKVYKFICSCATHEYLFLKVILSSSKLFEISPIFLLKDFSHISVDNIEE